MARQPRIQNEGKLVSILKLLDLSTLDKQILDSLSTLGGLLDLVLLHLLLDYAGCLLCRYLLQSVLDLEHSFVEYRLINVVQECLVADHCLRELDVADRPVSKVLVDVRDQHERHISYLVMGGSLRQKHLNNGLQGWQRTDCMSQPLQHVADGGEQLWQWDLTARIQRLSAALALSLVEESSHLLHELVVVKENADGSLKLVQLELLKQNISLHAVTHVVTYASLLATVSFLRER